MTRTAATTTLLSVTAVAAVLLLTASTAVAASPCKRWGRDDPSMLTRKHARAAVKCFVNRARARHDRQPLDASPELTEAAQAHTDYMKKKDCFDHDCGRERGFKKRLRHAGYATDEYSDWGAGENIAYGAGQAGSPKAIFRAWMKSPGHRENILERRFRDIGVGFASARHFANAQDAGIYTADFGYRRR